MGIGVGVFLMAIGAILKFAVMDNIQGIDLEATGVILMVVGVVGTALSLLFWSSVAPFGRRETIVTGGRRETVDVTESKDHVHV